LFAKGVLFVLLPPRLPGALPVGLQTAGIVLGVQGLVEDAADLFCQLRVAEFARGLPEQGVALNLLTFRDAAVEGPPLLIWFAVSRAERDAVLWPYPVGTVGFLLAASGLMGLLGEILSLLIGALLRRASACGICATRSRAGVTAR